MEYLLRIHYFSISSSSKNYEPNQWACDAFIYFSADWSQSLHLHLNDWLIPSPLAARTKQRWSDVELLPPQLKRWPGPPQCSLSDGVNESLWWIFSLHRGESYGKSMANKTKCFTLPQGAYEKHSQWKVKVRRGFESQNWNLKDHNQKQ